MFPTVSGKSEVVAGRYLEAQMPTEGKNIFFCALLQKKCYRTLRTKWGQAHTKWGQSHYIYNVLLFIYINLGDLFD